MPFGSRYERMPDKGPLFPASYEGVCNNCGWDIEPGDDIGYVDDEVVCKECWRDA